MTCDFELFYQVPWDLLNGYYPYPSSIQKAQNDKYFILKQTHIAGPKEDKVGII